MLKLAWNSVRWGYFDTLNTMEMLELFQLSNKLVVRRRLWAHNSAGNAQIDLKLGTVGYFVTLNTIEISELFQLSNQSVTGVVMGS